jgi:hypothetical protein
MYLGWLVIVAWHTLSVGGFNELWLIPFGLLAISNFIAIMSVHWSVAAEAFFTCKRVGDVIEASLIAVIPKEHGGKAAIVQLVHNNEKTTFSFHHQTFIWNEDRKTFSPLEYPDQLPFTEYRRATGLTTEQAKNAHEAYGLNKYIYTRYHNSSNDFLGLKLPHLPFWNYSRSTLLLHFSSFKCFVSVYGVLMNIGIIPFSPYSCWWYLNPLLSLNGLKTCLNFSLCQFQVSPYLSKEMENGKN